MRSRQLLPTLLTLAHVVGVKWYLSVVLIYMSLVTNEDEHLDVCLPAICISSSVKFLLMSFAPEDIVFFLAITDF